MSTFAGTDEMGGTFVTIVPDRVEPDTRSSTWLVMLGCVVGLGIALVGIGEQLAAPSAAPAHVLTKSDRVPLREPTRTTITGADVNLTAGLTNLVAFDREPTAL